MNDGGLCASRDLRRVTSHLDDRLLLPWEYGVTYPLQLGGAFPNLVDVTFDSVEIECMTLPVELGIPGKGPQNLSMEREARSLLLDLR
jgi:hypothetical protein